MSVAEYIFTQNSKFDWLNLSENQCLSTYFPIANTIDKSFFIDNNMKIC